MAKDTIVALVAAIALTAAGACSSAQKTEVVKKSPEKVVIKTQGQLKSDAVKFAKERAEKLFGEYRITKRDCEKKFESRVKKIKERTYTGMLNAYWICRFTVEKKE